MAKIFNLVSSALFALLFLQLAAAQGAAPPQDAPSAPVTCVEAPQDKWLVTQKWKKFSFQSLGVWYANVPALGSQPQRRSSLIERRKKKNKDKEEENTPEEQPQDQGEGQAQGTGADCTFTQLIPGGDGTLQFTNTASYRQVVCVTTVLASDKIKCYWLNAGDSCTTATSTQWLLFSAGPRL
ncbi:hypothetical protein ColKHC_11914 [Colletotrichum higginsianum]|nr:hypothetical protein ColKHC_11914 [Colletotrichum higginsianum]